MATKRNRPAFSPPRPSKSTAVSTAAPGRESLYKNQKNAATSRKKTATAKNNSGVNKRRLGAGDKSNRTKSAGTQKRGRPAVDDEDDDNDDDDDSEGFEDGGRSALALVDMQAHEDSDELDDEDDQDSVEEEGANDNDEDDEEENTRLSHRQSKGLQQQHNSSPEPDMILAEITTTNEPSDTAIPAKLVHRLLAHHFEKGEKTKISVDARDLVSRYLEVFVREAIMRSSFEKDENLAGGRAGAATSGGFLEVEDLEKAAVQLCLDF